MIDDKIIAGQISIGKVGLYLKAESEGGLDIRLHIVNLPEISTIGINNITESRHFCFFADYDNIRIEDLIKEIDYLANKFEISHWLILTTGENKYHVISFEKFELPELLEVMKYSMCDYSYKNTGVTMKKLDKGFILRFRPKVDYEGKVVKDKPEFVSVIDGSVITKRKISRAHLEFFCKIYPFFRELWKDNFHELLKNNYDDSTIVKTLKYGTSNKNFLMDNNFQGLMDSKRLTIEWTEDCARDEDDGVEL